MSSSPTIAQTRDYDGALSLVASLGAIIALWLLWADERGPQIERPQAESVATLTFSAAEVRRRAEGTLVWNDVQTGAPLFERDSVFVPPGGAARIELGDTVLELEENSLIVLERARGRAPAVQLVQGGVSGSSGEGGLELRGASGTVQLARDSEARLSTEGDRGQIALFSGSATVKQGAESLTLAGKQRSVLERSGKLAAAPLGAELRLPSRNAKIFYQGVARVALQWKPEEGSSHRLQLARDRRFEQLVPTPSATAGEYVLTASEPGVYWWRLIDGEGRSASETRSFVLVEQVPPTLTSPGWNEVVDYVVSGAIPFSWSGVPGAARYRIQISSTPDFERPRIDQVVKGTQLRYQGPLSEGVYYWRVKAELSEGNPPYAAGASFRLILKPLLEAPELIDAQVEVHRASE